MHPVQRITDRIRKLGLQQKKVCDPFWSKFGSAGLAVSLECGTTAQQANPIQIIRMLVDHKISVQQNANISSGHAIFAFCWTLILWSTSMRMIWTGLAC